MAASSPEPAPAPPAGLLKISQLAERSGVSAGTIKHYLREGLLGADGDGVVRTSRNMAWYPPEYVERVRLIKRLQEERFLPLHAIRQLLADDPERAARLVELEDRILARALERREGERVSAAEVRRRYDVPRNVLDRLAELGVLTPTGRGFDADDVAIIAAIARFRSGGYDEALGFTVYDTLRYTAPPTSSPRAPSRSVSSSGPCTPSCCWPSCAGRAATRARAAPRGRRRRSRAGRPAPSSGRARRAASAARSSRPPPRRRPGPTGTAGRLRRPARRGPAP